MDIRGIPLERRNVIHVMERALETRPNEIAVQDPNSARTYLQAWDEALEIAGGFDRLGVGRQRPVLLMLDNEVAGTICWLALGLTARIEIPINTAYRGGMLAYLICDSDAELLIIEEHYLPRLIEIAGDVPCLRTLIVRRASPDGDDSGFRDATRLWKVHQYEELRAGSRSSPEKLDPWDLFSITYTSGTTGRSKGVLCPHAHAFGQATSDGIGTTWPGEIRFVVLPQFHAAGRWGGVYHALIHQATAHIAPSFSASRYWEQARAIGARTSQLVGSMAEFLRCQPARPEDRDHNLRELCILPLPPALDEWKKRFGVEVTTSYGSTETGTIIDTVSPAANSIGTPREGYDVRIVDEHDLELPAGQVGEAVVRPALPWTTSVGYLGRHEETVAAWRNGWLHTGDALYRDSEGNFFFVDRLDDAIRRRGENISSAEVELHVAVHPAVAECAAVAVPSEFAEDEIKVAVVLEPGAELTEAELIDFLAEEMPAFMVPRYLNFLNALPKTATSKIRKTEIRRAGIIGCWDRCTATIVKS